MSSPESFPLRGVIGVVANSPSEIDAAVEKNLQCVEIRADLLLDGGMSLVEVMSSIQKAKASDLACLLTLRHPSHGGKFAGTEQDRVAINRQALEAGADVIDLERNSDAAAQMLAERAPLILSYHNFDAIPDEAELARLTQDMSSLQPLAIKVVPTADKLEHAIRMLRWVNDADANSVKRIGFAMGLAGTCSRILTTVCGAPITYASFGDAVAPGQVALDALLYTYRVMQFDQQTTVVAITGSESYCTRTTADLNHQFRSTGTNRVAVEFGEVQLEIIEEHKGLLRISEIHTEQR